MAHQVKAADFGTRYEGASAEKMLSAVQKPDEFLKGACAKLNRQALDFDF